MVGEVGVHDDDEIASGILQAMDVGSTEAQLARSWLEDDALGSVKLLELLSDLEGPVRRGVVDNDQLPIELVLGEGSVEQPDQHGQVGAFVVGREKH